MTDYVSVWEYVYQYMWQVSLLILFVMGLVLESMFRERSGFVDSNGPLTNASLPEGEKT